MKVFMLNDSVALDLVGTIHYKLKIFQRVTSKSQGGGVKAFSPRAIIEAMISFF